MKNKTLLNIELNTTPANSILEKIKSGCLEGTRFVHVVSLNPENIVVAQKDFEFKSILNNAEIKINDGIGIVLASQILKIPCAPRLNGVDLMEKLLNWGAGMRLPMLLIGGSANLAESIANCYLQAHPGSKIEGIQGLNDIASPQPSELSAIKSIVANLRPRLIFVAFGSPSQEKWIEANKEMFQGAVCMGVGGSFDFIGKKIGRAPRFVRNVGLEWLYRLIRQPSRVMRQTRLIVFIWLVMLQFVGIYALDE